MILFFFYFESVDRGRTTLQCSEPSSRPFLYGEQPYPSYLFQHEEKRSRHRGAEIRIKFELKFLTSLLSLKLL